MNALIVNLMNVIHFVIYYAIPFVIVLGILIFFHELGHFLVAKFSGVKVLKFSLGFGNKLLGKKVGETEYLISSIPLGGYVKMLGENDDETETVSEAEYFRMIEGKTAALFKTSARCGGLLGGGTRTQVKCLESMDSMLVSRFRLSMMFWL